MKIMSVFHPLETDLITLGCIELNIGTFQNCTGDCNIGNQVREYNIKVS